MSPSKLKKQKILHPSRGTGEDTGSYTVTLCLILLRQGLSVKLELDWQPANPRTPPVSAFAALGLRAHGQPHSLSFV